MQGQPAEGAMVQWLVFMSWCQIIACTLAASRQAAHPHCACSCSTLELMVLQSWDILLVVCAACATAGHHLLTPFNSDIPIASGRAHVRWLVCMRLTVLVRHKASPGLQSNPGVQACYVDLSCVCWQPRLRLQACLVERSGQCSGQTISWSWVFRVASA